MMPVRSYISCVCTSSDIGPARDAPDMPQSGGPAPAATQAPGPKAESFDSTQYDEEYGYGGSLFGDTPYEEDDAEADRIYEVNGD